MQSWHLTVALAALMLGAVAEGQEVGLAAHWSFDEGSGETIADVSGNGNDATIHGARFVKTQGGHCLEFDGQTNYVDCGAGPSLDLREAVTVEAWIFPAGRPSGEPGVLGKHFQSYLLTYYHDGQCWFYINEGANNVHYPVPTGSWHHVAATFDGKMLRMYVDGKLGARTASKAGTINSGGKFLAGCVMGDPNASDPAYTRTTHFLGMLDEVRVYSRALSDEEIAAHAQAEAPMFEITEPFPRINAVCSVRDDGLSLQVGDRGDLQVRAGREAYSIASQYSYPGETVGWHRLGGPDEPGWTVTAGRARGKAVEVCGSGPLYDVRRRAELKGGKVFIEDTITSRTDEPVGLMVRHNLTSRSRFASSFAPGGAEAPVCLLEGQTQDLGVVLEDNVSRHKYQPVVGLRTNRVSLRLSGMALAPGKRLVLRWSMWPLPAKGGYFDFINAVRREWRGNYTVQGPFSWISMTDPILDKPEELKAYLERKRVSLMAISPWLDYDSHNEPRVWTREEYKAHALRTVKALKAADPDIRCVGCIETDWVTIYPEQIPGGEKLPVAGTGAGGLLTREQTAIVDAANLPWKDSVKRDIEGGLTLELYMRGGKPQTALAVYPALGNYQYEFLLGQVKFLLDDVGLDGYYIDEFSQAWSDTLRSYEGWDGVSADLDLTTGAITRKFVDCGLAGVQARVRLAKYALDRGKVVIANTYASAMEERGLPVNRFSETWWMFDPMLTPDGEEPLAQPALFRSNLASPIGLGILGHPEEHDTARRLMKAIVTYLRHGMVYYHYFLEDIPVEGPGSGEYGPVNHMFPITPIELGEGFVIGKERTITCVAGTYYWPHEERPVVLVFDLNGRRTATDIPAVREGNRWRVDVDLTDWAEIAIIEAGE